MNEIDFTVTKVNWVIQRPRTQSWHADKLLYKHEYVMVIILEGEVFYTVKETSFSAKKNDVLIFAPGVARMGRTNQNNPWAFISVSFNFSYNNAAHTFFNQNFLHFNAIGEYLRSKFADIAYDWEGKNPLYQIRCKNLVSNILYDIITASLPYNKTPHLKKLESARTYMQVNFKQEISIEDLANRLSLSPSYFRKLFKTAYGMAPKQYIINLRINSAQDLLLSGEVNISEAAALSGFDDIYYFSTLFKKQTGLSPTKFIQANR